MDLNRPSILETCENESQKSGSLSPGIHDEIENSRFRHQESESEPVLLVGKPVDPNGDVVRFVGDFMTGLSMLARVKRDPDMLRRRRERKRKINRESSKRKRVRAKEELSSLEKQRQQLNAVNKDLKTDNEKLRAYIQQLGGLMGHLQTNRTPNQLQVAHLAPSAAQPNIASSAVQAAAVARPPQPPAVTQPSNLPAATFLEEQSKPLSAVNVDLKADNETLNSYMKQLAFLKGQLQANTVPNHPQAAPQAPEVSPTAFSGQLQPSQSHNRQGVAAPQAQPVAPPSGHQSAFQASIRAPICAPADGALTAGHAQDLWREFQEVERRLSYLRGRGQREPGAGLAALASLVGGGGAQLSVLQSLPALATLSGDKGQQQLQLALIAVLLAAANHNNNNHSRSA